MHTHLRLTIFLQKQIQKQIKALHQKLIRTVDENNFNAVLTQMVEDSDFFKPTETLDSASPHANNSL